MADIHCQEHLAFKGRLTLMLTLLTASTGGVVAILLLCVNIYVGLNDKLARVERDMGVTTEKVTSLGRQIDEANQKLRRLEDYVFRPSGLQGGGRPGG